MSVLDKKSVFRSSEVIPVVESLTFFSSQIEQAWNEVSRIPLDTRLKGAGNIVLVGMGGSALGAEVLKDLEFGLLRIPLEIVRGYHLPAYVDGRSLVILSSYSGNTEEVLSVASEAIAKTNRIFVFATGGELEKFGRTHRLAMYDLIPMFNPSSLPRLSLGYSLTMLLSLLARLSFLKMNSRRIKSVVSFLAKEAERYATTVEVMNNPAKRMASGLNDRLPLLVSGSHLFGATVAVRNMFHETAKSFAVAHPIPELNHHLLEGLTFPKEVMRRLTVIFLASRFDHKEIRQRMKITAQILEKRGIAVEWLAVEGKTPLEEVYWIIQFFGYSTFYLAMLYGVDPRETPWVDYLKKRLYGMK